MDWGGFDFAATISGTTSQWVLSPSDLRLGFVDPTVIRSFVVPHWRTNGVVTAAGLLLAIGLIAWDGDPDSTAVPTDPPDPANDPEADWIINAVYPLAEGTTTGTTVSASLDFYHESKAMRRLGNTRGLLMCAEVVTAAGGLPGFTASVTAHCRYLLKE